MRVVCALLLAAAVSRGQKSPTSPEQDRILVEIRDYALHYIERLPDYTSVQRTRRDHDAIPFLWWENSPVVAGKDPPHRLSTDVIEEEFTVTGTHAQFAVLKINGAPSTLNHDQLGETISGDTFASILDNIFEPNTGARFAWERLGKLNGRSVVVFALDIPRSKGFEVHEPYIGRDVSLACKGLVYADPESKAVMRVEVQAAGFPEGSFFKGIDFTLDYVSVRLNGRKFVLPDRFELHWRTNGRSDSVPDPGRRSGLLPEESNTYGQFKRYQIGSATASTSPLVKR